MPLFHGLQSLRDLHFLAWQQTQLNGARQQRQSMVDKRIPVTEAAQQVVEAQGVFATLPESIIPLWLSYPLHDLRCQFAQDQRAFSEHCLCAYSLVYTGINRRRSITRPHASVPKLEGYIHDHPTAAEATTLIQQG